MSAHPDDLVFSTFSALIDKQSRKIGLVFFNVSTSTRWGGVPRGWLNLPKVAISIIRTLEDKFALGNLGVKSFHFYYSDSKAGKGRELKGWKLEMLSLSQTPEIIYAPLGVGRHPDHISVRKFAILLWRYFQKKPKLIFYEDLPYAFLLNDLRKEERKCMDEVSEELEKDLEICYYPLTKNELSRKLRYMRLYFSQMNTQSLSDFGQYASLVGRQCGMEYAEKFALVQQGK